MAAPPDAALADALAALSSLPRLALLRELRVPKTLREIEVRASEGEAESERNISRQSVRKHLDRLLEVGVVAARDAEREYGATVEYVVNHQKLYALSEAFRGLARLRPVAEPPVPTMRASEAEAGPIRGPCLVLVKGLEEGRAFPLAPPPPSRGWVLGRRRDAEVSLDFDPFVSAENSVVEWAGGHHVLRDLATSRNGTVVNFRPIPKGGSVPLRHGDLVGVGCSILMFSA